MPELLVVLFYMGSGPLRAVILKWNWMFHSGVMTPECDVWEWGDPADKQGFKEFLTELLKEHGFAPKFIDHWSE